MRSTNLRKYRPIIGVALVAIILAAPSAAFSQQNITLAFASPISMTNTSVEVAMMNGYFKEVGLNVKDVRMKGSPLAVAALMSGNAQFAVNNVSTSIQVLEKGEKILNIALFQNVPTIEIVMSSKVAKEKGITEKSPLGDRVKALQGLRVGITSRGGVPDLFVSYALGSQGLDPDSVTKVPLGSPHANIAALKRGDVQAFCHALPNTLVPIAQGFGITLVSGPLGDLKALSPFAYGSIQTKASYAAKNPDITRKMAQAIARANRFIKSNPSGTLALLKKKFSKTPPKVIELSLQRVIAATAGDSKFTPEGVRNAEKFLLRGKKIKRSFSDAELKQVYTNDFLK